MNFEADKTKPIGEKPHVLVGEEKKRSLDNNSELEVPKNENNRMNQL
jgi:hypothetical protein